MRPLLEIKDVECHFPGLRRYFWSKPPSVRAVDGVSLHIMPGEALGLVGESGCGKSTLGNLASALLPATGGEILFEGVSLKEHIATGAKDFRNAVQVIFQDPSGTLNPRLPVIDQVVEPLNIRGDDDIVTRYRKANEALIYVGLTEEHGLRYPHELSGGQRQRVVIARALVTKPRLVVCDEPTSALDVSIQAQIINLLVELKSSHTMAYLFISHNLSVVRSLCEKIAVMYLGKIVELAPCDILFSNPQHPYTQALLAANPIPDPSIPRRRALLSGDPPSPMEHHEGCRFYKRCQVALPECASSEPPLIEIAPGHFLACTNFLHTKAVDVPVS